MRNIWNFFAVLLWIFAVAGPCTLALPFRLSENLGRDILHDSVPFVFSPEGLSAADFEVHWVGDSPQGVTAKLGAQSFEWVRVNDIFVLPRGRLLVEIQASSKVESAQLQIHDQTSAFVLEAEGANLRAEAPIGLFSGKQNQAVVEVIIGGKRASYRLEVRFRRKKPVLLRDVSCSPYKVEIAEFLSRGSQDQRIQNEPDGPVIDGQFVYVGCRHVYLEGDKHATAALELYVFWEGASDVLKVNGHPTEAFSPHVWSFQARAKPGDVTFEDGQAGNRLRLTYRIPDHQRLGNVALGVGPYFYQVQSTGDSLETLAPVLTVYGSFFLNEGMRIVGFNATAPARLFYSDTGVYLLLEQSRFLDQRLSMNVFLGGHALLFNATDGVHFKPSAPQGVEIIFRDFILKRHNIALGSFILPTIDRRNYYNLWLRWGTPQLFGEINYIAWQEPTSPVEVLKSTSLGLCLGFPLFQFW